MSIAWTDHPLAGGTPVRATHINELRSAVAGKGVAPATGWTDHPVTTAIRVKAVHLTELANAIGILWATRELGLLPNWTAGSPPSSGRAIAASDITDLRAWFDTIADL
jgi:hypothetical protein